MKKFLTMLMLAALVCAGATAQVPAWNEIKGELKTALQANADMARGAAAFEPCQGCHRKDGSGRVSGAYPRLSGQHATVLMKQMADIRSGRRSNPKMEPFIDDHVLTPFEIADIAVYLQGLPIAAENGKGPGLGLAKGKQLYERDCAGCHGGQGEGDAAKFYPMVAAQHYRYLLREVQLIRDGDRRNANPDMVRVIKPYSSGELEAVADYMAAFAPPKKQ
ncbi:MAG: c-type cytochrome [Rhodoferax sp.]|uniref:c-type cytochrome n=1 Tax=Rhodoferax sp. TaxID=50421 RepID=UPI002622CB9C|nr:c-type cytochrome [Rhodoferax sp.]MDD5334255.1 c-type cytochrome [Rhodoferax sp.]